MEASSEEFVVYLRCSHNMEDVWYRVVVETDNITGTGTGTGTGTSLSIGKKRKGVEGQIIPPEKDFGDEAPIISPVAVISVADFGYGGGWTVIGDDIYWTGGCCDLEWYIEVKFYSNLLKHNINDKTLTSWERVRSLTIPRKPFLAAVGTSIAVVAGTYHTISGYDCQVDSSVKDENWIVSPDSNSELNIFESTQKTTTDLEDSKKIVSYNFSTGNILIRDAFTGDKVEERLIGLALQKQVSLPLLIAAHNTTGVFHKRTLYWFTDELVLYGYDIDQCQWFQSECLQQQLHPLEVNPPHEFPLYPLLLGLPNGKFLALVRQKGLFHMASFSVEKGVSKSMLGVNVEHIQYFRFEDFMAPPFEGIAIRLKNTGSATRCG